MLKISQKSILRASTVFIVLLLWQMVSPVTAFFWTLFFIWAVFRLNPRIIGVGNIITLLFIIPLALDRERDGLDVEQLATYVFYLLCITVILQIIELCRDKNVTAKDYLSEK